MSFTIPPKPTAFDPMLAAPGCELNLFPRYAERARIKPRTQHAHTNGASRESTLQAQHNWATRAWGDNTMPHYLVDRAGRAWKTLPTDRKGIGTTTVKEYRGDRGGTADWTLVYETTDTGYLADPGISAFTDAQAERVAVIFAYESMTHGIPLTVPTEWWGAGSASHTDPFGYPWTTIYNGKTCPGLKKKKQVRDLVLPRARQIVAAWTDKPTPPPAPDGTLLPHGWYRVRKDEWPWSIAVRVWGQGSRHVDITSRNRPQPWEVGSFIEIVDTPTVIVTVKSGEGLHAVIRRALPGEDPRIREAATWAFNGDEHGLRAGEVVSVPVNWRPAA